MNNYYNTFSSSDTQEVQSKVRTAAGHRLSRSPLDRQQCYWQRTESVLFCSAFKSRDVTSPDKVAINSNTRASVRLKVTMWSSKQVVHESLTTKNACGRCVRSWLNPVGQSGASSVGVSAPAVWAGAACTLIQDLHWWTPSLCNVSTVLLFARNSWFKAACRFLRAWDHWLSSLNQSGLSGINLCNGARGQTSVIYAIVWTFTPIYSTVYHVLSDNDRLQHL